MAVNVFHPELGIHVLQTHGEFNSSHEMLPGLTRFSTTLTIVMGLFNSGPAKLFSWVSMRWPKELEVKSFAKAIARPAESVGSSGVLLRRRSGATWCAPFPRAADARRARSAHAAKQSIAEARPCRAMELRTTRRTTKPKLRKDAAGGGHESPLVRRHVARRPSSSSAPRI